MRKKWLIVAAAVLVLALVGLVVKNKFLDRQAPAALQIATIPPSVIFIDGVQVGTTGEMGYIDDKIEPGEHTIRLVPETDDENLISWEGKVNLTSGVMVVINQVLADSQTNSSGEILTLEKIGSRDKSSLSVISVPDNMVIKIDGEPEGFTPKTFDDWQPGSYQVMVGSAGSGYQGKTISAKTIAGYRLIVNVQLAKEIEGIEEATASAEEKELEQETTPMPEAEGTPTPELERPYVKIKDTPTGWLRVREGSSTGDSELAKVEPGETYPYLEEEENGWYKIEYEEGKEGWISSTYAELVE